MLSEAQEAARFAHETATNKENTAENKYDTLGQEAAYLAAGQSQRVHEITADLKTIQRLHHSEGNDICAAGSLVSLESSTASKEIFLISPCQAGIKLVLGHQVVHVISTEAPVGQSLIGLCAGDEININGTDFEIVSVD